MNTLTVYCQLHHRQHHSRWLTTTIYLIVLPVPRKDSLEKYLCLLICILAFLPSNKLQSTTTARKLVFWPPMAWQKKDVKEQFFFSYLLHIIFLGQIESDSSLEKIREGSFNNYVDQILPTFDPLPPWVESVDILKNLPNTWTSRYLPFFYFESKLFKYVNCYIFTSLAFK